MKTKSNGWWRCLPSRPCGAMMQRPKPASISFFLLHTTGSFPPNFCCALDCEAARACPCGLGHAGWGHGCGTVSHSTSGPWPHPARAPSNPEHLSGNVLLLHPDLKCFTEVAGPGRAASLASPAVSLSSLQAATGAGRWC